MRIRIIIQKLIAPLLMAVFLSACSTTDTLTPPADLGSSTPAPQSNQDFVVANQAQQPPPDENQFPVAPGANAQQAQVPVQQQQGLNSPMLGSPGGISATNRSIFQSPNGQQATAAVSGSIRFLPVIGAPVSAVTPLSTQLAAAARGSGLTLKSASDTSADHMLKGYFSAFADGGQTTIVYVWDVLNPSGVRLHRIQGQEKVNGTAADNWSVVPAPTMQKIASDTIAAYINWRQNAGG